MTLLTVQVDDARITITINFKDCPFCGSPNLDSFIRTDSTGVVDIIHCQDCQAEAPAGVWNRRDG